ncbi:glutathione S-transferase family protein [Marinobacter sp. C2H3]|uniref:glutathione S-transferase family protein n=1 Tax=Marinobacter sp. C2H3 TaxID=3119003 RepID=UPI00300ED8B9
MTVRLYQFAISHYCEKIRWALDHKAVHYQTVNLLPGQHIGPVRKLTGAGSSVPVLDDNGVIVQGSAAIIDHLDEHFPENPLTPRSPVERDEALAWEHRLDEEAGPAVRIWCYHYLLQRPKRVIPMLTAGTPFYNRILLSLAFSRVDETMRKWMKINQKTADAAEPVMAGLLAELAEAYRDRPFLVGNRLSRADLAAGALFAPLFQPAQYPVPWPAPRHLLPPMSAWLASVEEDLAPVADMYQANRGG